MKVFNISAHRTGTRSFHSWCCAHGLHSQHWCGPDVEQTIENPRSALRNSWDLYLKFEQYFASAEVFADFPTPLLYQPLAQVYPDAKFVMLWRPTGGWVSSVRRLKGDTALTANERIFYDLLDVGFTTLPSDHEMSIARLNHRDAANAYFEGSERLFTANLDDIDLGEKLAAFMGFDMRFPFPREADQR